MVTCDSSHFDSREQHEGKYLFSSSKESTLLLFADVFVENLFDVVDFILSIFIEFPISIFSLLETQTTNNK